MIKPTVGRIVWYRKQRSEVLPGGNYDEPLAAIITRVWSDGMVNLAVFDGDGVTHPRTSVPLIQGDQPKPELEAYCEWMPYQIGQAVKTQELQKQLKSA